MISAWTRLRLLVATVLLRAQETHGSRAVIGNWYMSYILVSNASDEN